MKEYKVISGSVFHSGKIKLTADQARKRVNQIKKLGGNVYDIIEPVSFKAGEVISLEKASNAYLQTLQETDAEKAKTAKAAKAAEAKAKADAKAAEKE